MGLRLAIWCLLMLPLGSQSQVWGVECVADGGALKKFADIDLRKAQEDYCNLNSLQGAEVDKKAAKGTGSEFACLGTASEMKKAAEAFKKQQEKQCKVINKAMRQSQTCSAKKPAEQNNCVKKANELFAQAKKAQEQLLAELQKAQDRIRIAGEANLRAMREYAKHDGLIRKAVNESHARGEQQGQAYDDYANAQGLDHHGNFLPVADANSEVKASDGAASSLAKYLSNISGLVREQATVIQVADEFINQTEAQEAAERAKLQSLSELSTRGAAGEQGFTPPPSSGDGKGGQEGHKRGPEQNQADAKPPEKEGGGSGISPPSGAGGGSEGGGTGENSTYGSDDSAPTVGGRKEGNLGTTSRESPSASNSDPSPIKTPAVGSNLSPGLSSSRSASGAAARRSPAGNSSPSATAVSASGSGGSMGGGGGGDKTKSNGGSGRGSLDSGGLNLAGSDINAAVGELADEFGLGDAESGTAEPGAEGLDSSGDPLAEGQSEFGVNLSSAEENFHTLWVRCHSALQRAQKRGNTAGPRRIKSANINK